MLIIGLGNPKKEFINNRHNSGRIFVDWIYKESGLNFDKWFSNKKLMAELAKGEGGKIILAKPLVFMNESGRTVNALKKVFKLNNHNIIVAHDESDLNIGDFKISKNKNAAGHHGIGSIFDHLKTKDITRVRIGIRPEPRSGKRLRAGEFVLKDFSKSELEQLNQVFKEIVKSLPLK